jgi:DNA-directed RNA polymerase II subunit RPB1
MSSSQKSKMPEYRAPSKIIGVQFSILSPEEIRKNSVVEVTSRDTYINNKPVIGGLFDPRMGVLEPGILCPTDGLTYIDTPGYFGHIELARPVFFIQHLKEIMKILKCFCFKCSKLLINKNHHKHVSEMTSENKWEYMFKLISKGTKIKRCGDSIEDGCGCRQPDSIKLEGMAMIYAIWDNIETNDTADTNRKVKIRLTPEIVLKIFKRISDEDIHFIGFNPIWSRPEWMICQVLPIAPPAVRPSVKHDAQQRSEDDLTHIYCNIIKTNNDLFNKIKEQAQANAIEGLSTLLQYFIAMIVNNKVKGSEPMAQRSGRPMQCIMGRLNSKNGRIRGNLMGKRVDFSARSVITGDPNLSIRQLGVPIKIAMNITKPVVVNDRNHKFLLKLIQNGPDVYPGAKILEKKNGENISLRYVDRNSIQLENGDIVHRHIMNDDGILFNRQPSLHRMSMMCHRAKIMSKGDTFRINVGCTKPYNADFDGDEMNAHFPQNILAETELKHLAAIPYQIISPANNSPIIGIYQDSMLGSYRFTRPGVKMTPRDAMNLLMMYKNVDVQKINDKTELTSFDVLSQIMPPITMMYKTKLYEDNEDYQTSNNVMEIRNGTYIRGQMEKSVLGSSTKGIIHRACNDFTNMTATNFIDDLQNIITEYMKSSSFSVGVSDLVADRQTNEQIIRTITEKKTEVQSVIDEIHLGIFKNTTASSNKVEFETKVNNLLNKANEESGKIGRKSLSKNNRFLMIVNSGSKGSLINISQMISCIGQQNIDGKRIPYGFDSRTLPHYTKFDDSPNARGFIENSYITGLTAPELFFHAMGGRIGLIDTAVKTSQTGYIQRRLIKGLEDLKIEYDMTVRNSKGKIIQFMYGDDGFDATRVENQNIPLTEMSLEDIYMHYDILGLNENDSNLLAIYSKGTITRMKKERLESKEKCKKYIDEMIDARDAIVQNIFKNKNENSIKIPVAFQNIIVNIQGQLNLNANSIVDITPLEAFQLIEEYFEKIKQIYFVPPTELFKIMYFFYLTPRDLLVNKRYHRSALQLLLETILLKYKQAIVHPGEMVGVIAGQSIGEPTTQLTLNTFHLAGVASKSNVTRGVPRIEEILRLTNNPKNPSLTVHLKIIDETDQDKAIQFSNMMDYIKLIDLIKSVEICFDPIESNTFIKEDQLFIKQFNEFEQLVKECMEDEVIQETVKSKWIVRMEIDPELLLDKNITMDDIHFAIKNSHYGNDIHCIYSDYNMDKLIFRIRMNSSIFSKNKKKGAIEPLDQSDEIYLLKNFQDSLLNNIVLRGISGIANVVPRKVQNMLIKEEGKFIRKDIWVLDTTGSNLLETLSLDYIDTTRTYSNDIKEIFNVLGIEAARQVLYNEFAEVMEFADVYINYHHLSLLCDRMTCTKDMVSIFRSGILNDDIGPISKSTFEVHTEVLLNASRHAELDHMRGVSAAVMMGQFGYYGTNAFNLVWDIKEMDTMEDVEISSMRNKQNDIEKMFDVKMGEGDACSKSNILIKNNIEHIKINTNSTMCDDDYNMGL